MVTLLENHELDAILYDGAEPPDQRSDVQGTKLFWNTILATGNRCYRWNCRGFSRVKGELGGEPVEPAQALATLGRPSYADEHGPLPFATDYCATCAVVPTFGDFAWQLMHRSRTFGGFVATCDDCHTRLTKSPRPVAAWGSITWSARAGRISAHYATKRHSEADVRVSTLRPREGLSSSGIGEGEGRNEAQGIR